MSYLSACDLADEGRKRWGRFLTERSDEFLRSKDRVLAKCSLKRLLVSVVQDSRRRERTQNE